VNRLAWVALLSFACASAPTNPACGEAALAAVIVECRAKVRAECQRGADGLPESSCPVLQACDHRIDLWEDCE
jgi:hypothetical protein